MSSKENLYHKLLGLSEQQTAPTYYEMLDLPEGGCESSRVEEQYKKQIQKVQKFTNNPKYKEGALFIKGELRQARSTLVDEGRRMGYQRELLQRRTTEVRNVLRPLLIKGYLVDDEYKYLSQNAAKLRVPEPVVQSVIKQELQKKGIDPSQALVDHSSFKKGSALPLGPGRKKKAAPRSLSARMPWMRYLHPAELLSLETWAMFAMLPLRMLGIGKPAQPKPMHDHEGFIAYHPYLATSLFWVGLVGFGLGFYQIHVGTQLDAKEALIEQYQRDASSVSETVRRAKAPLKKQIDALDEQLRQKTSQLAAKISENDDLKRTLRTAQAKIADLEKNGGGGPGMAALQQQLREKDQKIEFQDKMIKRLIGGGGNGGGNGDNAKLQAEIARLKKKNTDDRTAYEANILKAVVAERQKLSKQLKMFPVFRDRAEDLAARFTALKLGPDKAMARVTSIANATAFVRVIGRKPLARRMRMVAYRIQKVGEVTMTTGGTGTPKNAEGWKVRPQDILVER